MALESVRSSDREGWFILNGDIEIRIEENSPSIQAEYDSEKYTEDEIRNLASEFFESIIEYYENKQKEQNDAQE